MKILRCLFLVLLLMQVLCSCNVSGIPMLLEEKTVEVVLDYYANDSLKRKAAEFLIKNMPGKYGYEDDLINRYDTLFALYEKLYKTGNYEPDPMIAKQCWKNQLF